MKFKNFLETNPKTCEAQYVVLSSKKKLIKFRKESIIESVKNANYKT